MASLSPQLPIALRAFQHAWLPAMPRPSMTDAVLPGGKPSTPSGALDVGRGALAITAAKGWFLVTATVVNLGLGSLLSSVEYGDYGVTIRWVSLLNMMVVQGMLQGLSRAVSSAPDGAGDLRRQALKPVVLVSGLAGLLVLALAWPVAQFTADPGLTPLLASAALITAAYGVYAAMVGVLNGLRRFRDQALLDMGFSTAKLVGVLGAAALGLGAMGSVVGFGLAAVCMATVTVMITGGLPRAAKPPTLELKALLTFGGVVMAYQAGLNLLMFVDLGLVKRASRLGDVASDAAGFYSGAVNVAQMPYLACTAITFVVFPLLGAVGAQQPAAARGVVQKGLRYALLIGAPPAVALLAAAPGVLAAVFPPAYQAAANALRVLALGYVLTALSSVCCTMLNALGHPRASVAAVLGGTVVSAGLCWVAIPSWGLLGAAGGSVAGMAVTLGLAGTLLWRTGRAAFPWSSVLRHALVAVIMGLVGSQVEWPVGGAMARAIGLAGAAAAGVMTLVLLVAVREITRVDLDLILAVLRKKKGTP